MFDMFKRMSVEEALSHNTSEKKLKKSLGPIALILLGIGAIIGAGIFIVSGVASALTGPSVILSFIIAGTICALVAFCYAELSSVVTVTGGIYTFAQITMGKYWAWLAGWINIAQYTIVTAAIAIGWSGYLGAFLKEIGIILPNTFINIPAMLLVLVIGGILCLGASESTKINGIIVGIKLAVIGLFLAIGVSHINPANWVPFMPYGITGVLAATSMVFFAYTGFDAVASAAEEAKNPKRDLPIGIIGSLGICTALYIAVTIVMTGMAKYTVFAGSNAPIQLALASIGSTIATPIVTLGAIAGLTTVVLVAMYIVPRSIFAMSRDGLLPDFMSNLNKRTGAPVNSIIMVAGIGAILAGTLNLDAVVSMVNVCALVAFSMIAVAVVLLRRQRPELERGFRVPLVPWIPIATIILSGLLLSQMLAYLPLFIAWLVVGTLVFFGYQWYKARTVR